MEILVLGFFCFFCFTTYSFYNFRQSTHFLLQVVGSYFSNAIQNYTLESLSLMQTENVATMRCLSLLWFAHSHFPKLVKQIVLWHDDTFCFLYPICFGRKQPKQHRYEMEKGQKITKTNLKGISTKLYVVHLVDECITDFLTLSIDLANNPYSILAQTLGY